MKFKATVIPSGNASGVEVPDRVMQALGPEARPAVVITINGHSWRSRVASMRGQKLVGISAANRDAAGISQGDIVQIDLVLDTAPREVDEPPDLAAALDASRHARAAFGRLPFGLRQKHVRDIEAAKSVEVRNRRILRLVEMLAKDPLR
ncbi:MAG TPA: YdeI/OmpD-associated family protein [Devosia sp.]|nr:YdeI/OmpD-associated family protein [Devosia sp.]